MLRCPAFREGWLMNLDLGRVALIAVIIELCVLAAMASVIASVYWSTTWWTWWRGRRKKSYVRSPTWMGSAPDSLTPKEVYEIHRDYIEHEDHLVNHRTTLLITLQGALLAAFGIGFQKLYAQPAASNLKPCPSLTWGELWQKEWELLSPKSLSELPILEFNFYLFGLIVVGLITSYIGRRSIGAAANAILSLETHWNIYYYKNETRPEKLADYKLIPGITGGGRRKARDVGIFFVKGIPTFFICLWMVVFFLRLMFMLAENLCRS